MTTDSNDDTAGGTSTDTDTSSGPGERNLIPGLASVLLFIVFAAAFLSAEFGEPAGFEPGDYGVTHNIGFALFHIDLGTLAAATEGFLAAFLILAVTLDVAIDGALYLAKREEGGRIVSAVGGAFTRGRKVESNTGSGEGGE